jgi:hypothetical protein
MTEAASAFRKARLPVPHRKNARRSDDREFRDPRAFRAKKANISRSASHCPKKCAFATSIFRTRRRRLIFRPNRYRPDILRVSEGKQGVADFSKHRQKAKVKRQNRPHQTNIY